MILYSAIYFLGTSASQSVNAVFTWMRDPTLWGARDWAFRSLKSGRPSRFCALFPTCKQLGLQSLSALLRGTAISKQVYQLSILLLMRCSREDPWTNPSFVSPASSSFLHLIDRWQYLLGYFVFFSEKIGVINSEQILVVAWLFFPSICVSIYVNIAIP